MKKGDFDTVVEENDSYPSQSKAGSPSDGSGNFRGIEVSGDSELPSADYECDQTPRSVEWQVEISESHETDAP